MMDLYRGRLTYTMNAEYSKVSDAFIVMNWRPARTGVFCDAWRIVLRWVFCPSLSSVGFRLR